MFLVALNSITLKSLSREYLEECEEEGLGWSEYYILPFEAKISEWQEPGSALQVGQKVRVMGIDDLDEGNMKQLAVDWDQLTLAFDDSFSEIRYYLDTETGQVFTVMDEARRQLEEIYAKHFDPDNPDAFDIQAGLAEVDTADWQKNVVVEADFVEQHYGRRIITIPQATSYDAYDEMQDFIATI
ncbi:MAG: hypothetical protein KF770_03755 [Anaerolineae bacterium]|nr:hypothetical protein [Anaerolineae bacterium]